MGAYDTSLPHAVTSEAIKHHAAEVEEQLTHRLVSKGQVLYASIVAFFAWMFSVYDFILFGTLLPLIAQEFGWSTSTSVAIATYVSIGTFLVSLTVGPIADYFGRRNGLVVTVAGAALSSGLAAFTMSPVYLVIVRALSGFGYSEQAVNTTYLSEIFGARRRGFIYSFVQGGWPIGVLFASAVARLLLPLVGWRGVFLVATFPAIVILLLRLKLPESPRYQKTQEVRDLVRQGKVAEAEKAGAEYGVDASQAGHFTYWQLFAPDVRKHTIFLGMGFLLNWIGLQIFLVLITTVFTQGKHLSFTNALVLLIVSNALAYVGYVTHGYIGDRIGRRETIIGAWLLAAIFYTIMVFLAQGNIAVLVTYSIGLFFFIGAYAPLFTYMGESYPTRMRATGASFINAMGPIGAIIGSAVFTIVLQSGMNVSLGTFLAGCIPVFLSALALLGARHVPPGQIVEEIAI